MVYSLNTYHYSHLPLSLSFYKKGYDEEWSEISGTLRSLARNILVHRNRPGRLFQIHVVVIILQDGWSKASESLKRGIENEWGCPNADFITKKLKENINKQQQDAVAIFAPKSELFYPADMYDSESGATFHPLFVTKSRNAQKFNSHLIFFSLCNLLKPDTVFLTDAGTIYNPDCVNKLLEFLVEKKNHVVGVTARQRVMGERDRNMVQRYPSWSQKQEQQDNKSHLSMLASIY